MRLIAAEADFFGEAGGTARTAGNSKLTAEEQRQRRKRLALNAATVYLAYSSAISRQRRLSQVAGNLSINPSEVQALVAEGIKWMLASKHPGYRPTSTQQPLPTVKPRQHRRPRSAVFEVRRRLVLDYLKQNGSGSVVEISASLQLNPQTVNLLLKQMKANGDVLHERAQESRAYIWFIKQ